MKASVAVPAVLTVAIFLSFPPVRAQSPEPVSYYTLRFEFSSTSDVADPPAPELRPQGGRQRSIGRTAA